MYSFSFIYLLCIYLRKIIRIIEIIRKNNFWMVFSDYFNYSLLLFFYIYVYTYEYIFLCIKYYVITNFTFFEINENVKIIIFIIFKLFFLLFFPQKQIDI